MLLNQGDPPGTNQGPEPKLGGEEYGRIRDRQSREAQYSMLQVTVTVDVNWRL